jgi:hypothetical protein
MTLPQLLREPLLHFLVLGAAIFALFTVLNDAPTPVAANRLEVTQNDALRLARQFEATWRRPPTADELSNLIDRHVEEEVYVREAVALSLDRGDAVVRQRLAQKMRFLTESGAEAAQPTGDDLRDHLATHPERFARAAVVGFDQVLLAPDETEAAATLASLNAGEDPGEIAEPTLLPPRIPPAPRSVVDGTFGPGFFEAVAALPEGRWAGPVESGYGQHLVRVTTFEEGRVPPLDEIRGAVESDWRAAMRERLSRERLAALMSRYEIVTPDATPVLDELRSQ